MSSTKGFRPWFVGTARGLVSAVALLVLAGITQAVSSADVPDDVVVWVPIIVAVVRSAEGWVDDRKDPTPQAKRLGGGPAQ